MNPFLNIERDGSIMVLTMDQPELRNPLTGNSAVDEFLATFETIQRDRSIKVVVLTANGPAFSSGGNVKDMDRFTGSGLEPAPIRHEYRNGIQRLTLGLYNLEVPVIAAVNGPAMGAGLDLCTLCDIRIAAESARFCEAFINVGIIPGDGGAWLLPRVVGMARAAEMALTGQVLTAQQALDCGLVSRVVPDSELMNTAMSLAHDMSTKGGEVLRLTKRLLREGQNMPLASHLEMAAAFQALAHRTPEHAAAVESFKNRKKPVA